MGCGYEKGEGREGCAYIMHCAVLRPYTLASEEGEGWGGDARITSVHRFAVLHHLCRHGTNEGEGGGGRTSKHAFID